MYYQFFLQDRPTWLTATNAFAVSLLNAANAKYRGNTKTVEKSRYNYLYSSATNPNYTTNGFYYQTVAFPLATYAENLLILAEADIRVPVQPNTGAQIPKRFLYPQVEVDLNTSNPNPIPSLFTATPVNQ